MSYYGQNVNAILYVGASTADPLPASASDTFLEVELVQNLTPPTAEKSVGFFNILNDAIKRAIGGKKAEQIVEGTIVLDHDDASHLRMIADIAADDVVKRNWKMVYPDGWTRLFQGFLSRLADEPFDAAADAQEHRSAFRVSIDGAVTDDMITP